MSEPTVGAPASELVEWLTSPDVTQGDKRSLATRLVLEVRELHDSHDKLVEALEDLLTVNPRPVKVPGTSMTLAISYTEGDLVKFTNAKAALEEAKG